MLRLVSEPTLDGVECRLEPAEARQGARPQRVAPPVASIEVGQGGADSLDLGVAALAKQPVRRGHQLIEVDRDEIGRKRVSTQGSSFCWWAKELRINGTAVA